MGVLDTCQGGKSLFTSLGKHNGGSVQFGGGSKSKVIGKGYVNIPGMLTPQNVLLVDGLKANLLSISQLCGSEQEVHQLGWKSSNQQNPQFYH